MSIRAVAPAPGAIARLEGAVVPCLRGPAGAAGLLPGAGATAPPSRAEHGRSDPLGCSLPGAGRSIAPGILGTA